MKRRAFQRARQRFFLFIRTSNGLRIVFFFVAVLFLASLVVYSIERTRNEGFVSFFDSFWWTVVTISTVGYGDRLPQSVAGRVIAMVIIFIGVALMGTVTGRIASFIMERQMKEEKGLMDYSGMRGHFIICGWKREMNQVLYAILDANPELNPLEIVLVNRASVEETNAIRNDVRLKGIRLVHGDFIEERELIRAGIKGAAKVLVLADFYTEGNLQQIDSKTVMGVMTIKNLNKTAYVCAELLDTKFEKYLQLSHCEEILLARDFSRSILASASSGTGLSHVITALLSKSRGTVIETRPIPGSLADRTYEDLKCHFAGESGTQLIGLLENTGNITNRKKEALRDAQKNPDISALIPDLRNVKTLRANEPVINPPNDYLIKQASRAIVIAHAPESA